MKVSKYYKYEESYSGNKIMNFGLVESERFILSEEDTVICIDSNKNSEMSAIKKSDAFKYFKSLTSFTPREFLKIWSDDLEMLEEHQKESNPNYKKGEGEYLIGLAKLLAKDAQFSFDGIKFKII